MASEIQVWNQDVRVIPSNESLPLAPLEGEEDVFHALEQEEGDPVLYTWNSGISSFFPSTGPKPHRP